MGFIHNHHVPSGIEGLLQPFPGFLRSSKERDAAEDVLSVEKRIAVALRASRFVVNVKPQIETPQQFHEPLMHERFRDQDKNSIRPSGQQQAMQDQTGMGSRMLEILLEGVSTRQYGAVIPKMADTVGVSKSSVSRAAIQASEAQLERLLNRRFDDVDLLIIYVDGMHFGDQCVIGAIGVDEHGQKHVLGLQEGATENSAAAKDLLEDLVRRGVKPERRRLFVIDGSKALRAAINAVFGAASLVQRCRQHKLRNVAERLPKDQQEQTKSLMRAAWKLDAKEGITKLEKLAKWLEREHPDAADSLREGMEECFTINRMDIPPSLHRCLASTNLIENPHSGVRRRTRRVCRWRDKPMAKRWAAAAMLATEKNFRRVMGHKDMWALKAILDGKSEKTVDRREKVA